MDFIRRSMTQIQAQLSQLAASQKALIGLLALMVPLMMVTVWHYAASPQMVAVLPQAIPADKRGQITQFLDMHQIAYKVEGEKILVPTERRYEVQASLAAQQLLPEDTSAGFGTIVAGQNWWQSSTQNMQVYNIALQNELARVIKAYPWVRNATVIISRPQETGFGATHQKPSAAVNIVMANGRMDQAKVDAIAGLVSGAVAEMTPDGVTVIDAIAGRQFKVKRDDQLAGGDYMETTQAQERYVREKINETLRYIRNVIVAVNVEVDLTRKQTESTKFDQASSIELQKETKTKTVENSESGSGAEPGVRANTGADIGGGGAAGRKNSNEEVESTFEPHAGSVTEHSTHPGGIPTRISATVNIPRGYFVAIFKQGKADAKDPSDEDLKPLIETNLARIKKQIELLCQTKEAGQVAVDMYPDVEMVAALDGAGGSPAAAGVIGTLAGGETIKNGILGVLALASIGGMMLMVRKASQRPVIPTAAELAGIPPQLSAGDDVIGEVDASESPLAGMELNDDEIRHRKLADQVTDMVKANPSEAATLVKRWMKKPD
jgi:flagellar M-ring protein FliF